MYDDREYRQLVEHNSLRHIWYADQFSISDTKSKYGQSKFKSENIYVVCKQWFNLYYSFHLGLQYLLFYDKFVNSHFEILYMIKKRFLLNIANK